MLSNNIIITSEIINNSNYALIFDECVECIEVNLCNSEYEYYKCVYALNNIPFNLKKLIINIQDTKKIFNNKNSVNISRNGDLVSGMSLKINLPGIQNNTNKYTFEEFKLKVKIPYGCEFIINKN